MFGISIPLFLILLAWGLLLLAIHRSGSSYAAAFKPRMLTVLGALLVGGGFLFQPWLKISFLSYWSRIPDIFEKYIPIKVASWLTSLFGQAGASHFLDLFDKFTNLKGWQVALLPTYSAWIHGLMVFPLVLALVALMWAPLGAGSPGSGAGKVIGGLTICLALATSVAIILSIPDLDSAGVKDQFQWALVATLLGVRLGNGPWYVILGLLFLAGGGAVELTAARPYREPEEDGYSW